MTDPTDRPAESPFVGPTALGAEYAPFVYFDGVSTFGVNFGAIQIELAANMIVPDGAGGTLTKVAVTAHLRCSQNAISDLRQTIDKVLEMVAKSQQPQQQAPARLN